MVAGERKEGGISSITVKCKISESVGREVTGWGPAIKRLMTGERRVLLTTVKHQTTGEWREGSCGVLLYAEDRMVAGEGCCQLR